MTVDQLDRPAVQVALPPLHPTQQQIAEHPGRFRVVCCGRRWGKTMLASCVLFRDGLKGKRVWHVAPTYKQTLEAWDYLMRLVRQLPASVPVDIDLTERKITFPSRGSIEMRTGNDPNNLRGSGLDGLVLDEAAVMKPQTWDLVLRPALADRQGWALFISTPQHFNHFYEWFQHGEDPEYQDWVSWQRPTWDNPHIKAEEIEAARRDMDPADFDQEFGASFTAVGGAFFPALSANRYLYLRPMPEGLTFIKTGVGMDWGTTRQHRAAVVCGSLTNTGTLWIRSSWLNDTGDDGLWFAEAERCKRDYRATFARVDRSQSSARGRLMALGLQADTGVADVQARIGAYQGLIRPKRIFFDSTGPSVSDYYTHLCNYHKYPDTDPRAGQVVEEEDDDVDAGGYLIKELVPMAGIESLVGGIDPAQRRPSAPAERVIGSRL